MGRMIKIDLKIVDRMEMKESSLIYGLWMPKNMVNSSFVKWFSTK